MIKIAMTMLVLGVVVGLAGMVAGEQSVLFVGAAITLVGIPAVLATLKKPDEEQDPFMTFKEVLDFLDVDEAELKRLVSQGELRAHRNGDEMKFKQTDVLSLDLTKIAARRIGESRSLEFRDEPETLTDDLIFDTGEGLCWCPEGRNPCSSSLDEGECLAGLSTEPLDFTEEEQALNRLAEEEGKKLIFDDDPDIT